MPRRVMFVQLKTGYGSDQGPSWICRVDLSRSWATARCLGGEPRRKPGLVYGNFRDVDTDEEFWISGPKRDRTDTRYGPATTVVLDDVRAAYRAFLAGAPLPGRENG